MAQITTYNYFVIDSFNDLLNQYKDGVNSYLDQNLYQKVEKFEGGAYYLAFYPIAQKIIETQAKYNEILNAVYQFPVVANQVISRNNSTEDKFKELVKKNYNIDCSFKTMTLEEAGQLSIAFDFTEAYPDTPNSRVNLYLLMNENLVAGLWFNGDEGGYVLKKNSTFYRLFPAIKVNRDLIIEYKIKKNNQYPVLSPIEITQIFRTNFNSIYKLGDEFSNEEYLGYEDLKFASYINLKLVDGNGLATNAPVNFDFKEKLIINEITVNDITEV